VKVTCLAIERWYCIFRSLTYKQHFTRKRPFLSILAIWVGACLLQINKFFEWKLSAGKYSSVKAPYGTQGTQAMINRLGYYQFLYSMFYCLGFVCPYCTSVQDIGDSKMLRRAAKSSMFNSCVNPLIYWATNKEYRDELFELFKFASIKWSARNSYYLEYQMNSLGSSTLSQQSQT